MLKPGNYLHMNAKNKLKGLIAASYFIARMYEFWVQLNVDRVVLSPTKRFCMSCRFIYGEPLLPQTSSIKPSVTPCISLSEQSQHQRFFLVKASCFFNQSLIASSIAAACVISRRAQAISSAILMSLGILPRTSLISSLIGPTFLFKPIFTQPPRQSSFALFTSCGIAALGLQFRLKRIGAKGSLVRKRQDLRSPSTLDQVWLYRLKTTILLPSLSAPIPRGYRQKESTSRWAQTFCIHQTC